jgi:hypothetical protein
MRNELAFLGVASRQAKRACFFLTSIAEDA